MAHPAGESNGGALRLDFDRRIMLQFCGDGFWIHRVLQQEGIEGHVVDPASIATSRRRRRAKTDRIDGETLLRALLAYRTAGVCDGQGADR